jgi:hypothetical protein
MKPNFIDFLNEVTAEPDMIQQAFRMHVSERTDDLTRKEMLDELRTSANSPEELDRLVKQLERDPDALEQAAILYFEQAWEDESQRAAVRAAFEHAKSRLPVIETGILAVVAMYGMYLIATSGVSELKIRRKADGSYERTEKREPFAPVVSAVARLFTASAQDRADG